MKTPLVILGTDGADHRLLRRWVAEGRLPALAALMKRGCSSSVGGAEQIDEHGTQLSLLSGVSRARHGYYHYRQLRPGTYDLVPFSHADAGVPPFWSRLAGTGFRAAILDAPDSSLVEGLDGIQLLHWAEHQTWITELPACAQPVELLGRARRLFGPQILLSEYKKGGGFADDERELPIFLRRIEKKGELCRQLLKEGRFDLVVAGFYEAHTGGHRYWQYMAENRPAGAPESALAHALRSIYEAIDRELGLLIGELPAESNVFVYSAFGLESHYPKTDITEDFCRALGYQAGPAPGPPSLGPVALLRRLLPQALRVRLSRSLPGPLQEKLLADNFRNGSDWSKTTAFSIPCLYSSLLFVNLAGREPQGIVRPGEEYRRVLDRLENDLRALIDPDTGRAAVRRVTRTAENFGLDAPPRLLPDIVAEWTPSRRFLARAIHPKAELTQSEPAYFRDCYHMHDGFLAAAGPSIAGRGDLGSVDVLDMAPTFLNILGLPRPGDWSGKPVGSLS